MIPAACLESGALRLMCFMQMQLPVQKLPGFAHNAKRTIDQSQGKLSFFTVESIL
jgi:hypothetical protein